MLCTAFGGSSTAFLRSPKLCIAFFFLFFSLILAFFIRIMNQRKFGRQSESNLIEGQLTLFDSFNEVELTASESVPEPEISQVVIASYRRLHIIPETFIVDEHHVHVYASKDNDGTIVKAPRGTDLFRNSIATPSLVASIINGKYNNALPLERQARAYKSNGINLATNTMANWVTKSADNYLSLLYDRLHEIIYDNHIIHADETPVKVMRIDNNKIKNGKKTYMWVYRNRPAENTNPIVLFDWQPSRKADHPRDFLENFSGTVITDGYQVYHKLSKERDDLTIGGCWIHARRPFAEFIKSLKKDLQMAQLLRKPMP